MERKKITSISELEVDEFYIVEHGQQSTYKDTSYVFKVVSFETFEEETICRCVVIFNSDTSPSAFEQGSEIIWGRYATFVNEKSISGIYKL